MGGKKKNHLWRLKYLQAPSYGHLWARFGNHRARIPTHMKATHKLPFFRPHTSSALHPINPTACLTFSGDASKTLSDSYVHTQLMVFPPTKNSLVPFQHFLAQRIASLPIPFHKPESPQSIFSLPLLWIQSIFKSWSSFENYFSLVQFSPPPHHHYSPSD